VAVTQPPVGPGKSLGSKVQAIQADLAAGNKSTACGDLRAFVNEVSAQSGKKIPAVQASALIAAAQRIEAVIRC